MGPTGICVTQPKSPKIGKPLALTNAEFDQAAEVAPFDTAAAQALWRHTAPPKLVDLLDAEPDAQ